jgi:hypothetical protein
MALDIVTAESEKSYGVDSSSIPALGLAGVERKILSDL